MSTLQVSHRSWRLIGAAALAALSASGLPSTASGQGVELQSVKVVSVDGPLLLSVQTKKRESIRVYLGALDAPRGATGSNPAECGATLSADLLRELAPKGRVLRVAIPKARRATDGRRSLTEYDYSGRTTLTSSLIGAGAAREGTPTTGPAAGLPADINTLGYDAGLYPRATELQDVAARKRAGVWGGCGGRFHAPAVPAPAPMPAGEPWSISSDGITTAIGGLPLSADVRPSTATTFAAMRAVWSDTEFTREDVGDCRAWSATGGIVARGYANDDWLSSTDDRRPCDQQAIVFVQSLGPATPTSAGVRVGDATRAFRAPFPAAVKRKLAKSTGLGLAAGDSAPWAWATTALIDDGRVEGLSTELAISYEN